MIFYTNLNKLQTMLYTFNQNRKGGKVKALLLFFVVISCFISGCFIEEDMIPTPSKVVRTPLGTQRVKIGMTKNQVKHWWGDPTTITYEEEAEMGRNREVWIYDAKYSILPIDSGYLYKTKKLYFDGNNLTKMENLD